MGAGLVFEQGEDKEAVEYLAAHNELVASAWATKIAHEIDPDVKIGCMLAAGSYYPYSCRLRTSAPRSSPTRTTTSSWTYRAAATTRPTR